MAWERILATGRFLMFGDGETTGHPLFVDNLVDAFKLAQATPKADGEAHPVANELVHGCFGVLEGPPLRATHYAGSLTRQTVSTTRPGRACSSRWSSEAWSRRIVGWAMGTHLRTELVLEAPGTRAAERKGRTP